ncbi:MAG: peptide ABC transporter substrate-binding protein [Burkholderiales bacterium]|nr:peptide ABC transporter substrate-binding protein [Burkholderiales bacterium]MDE1927222.1 peptide ABC transporter substrate-binding protein [Burkholderiales bacterium]MDE2157557.1 peptide ABC transporter substrate-binding protein [Burkholderiales bacterium]MDE2503912.1 peptide ABC transporter substrate-binding protein [Burkholderiales bacterium]
MRERELQALIEDVRRGELPRRDFVARLVGLGLTAPMAGSLLLHAGVAQAQTTVPYKPTKRGGGGLLKTLWWQGPTLLNPHFAIGTKDQEGCRVFYEPLAGWDSEGNLIPILAAEIPTRENGGLAADGKSVVWKLKTGVTWHDGTPFTADDCLFNWQFATDPATAATTIGPYKDIQVDKIDARTIRVRFRRSTPFWAQAFVGTFGMMIPKHLFAAYLGAKSREAPTNLKPVGTGPYKFVEFRPGDLVRGAINPNYHMPNRPYFDTLEMKGGGDAVSAARAVLQTGEFDYAWNLQVEDDVLKRLEAGGRGRLVPVPGGDVEYIALNTCDPNVEVDGERASLKTRHPYWSDPAVRKAMALLVDRQAIQDFIYGRTGYATPNFLNNPPRFRSHNLKFEFNIDKAKALLDAAGWKPGADGVRAKGGVQLKAVFQTSINAPRQKTQQIIKQACQKAGIALELKSVTASVFFSSDVANPDTYGKFYADMEMYTTTQTEPDPATFMQQFISSQASTKANKWQGRNIPRWRSEAYDQAYAASEGELDPVKRAALFIRMNDLVCSDGYVIPLVNRPRPSGVGNKLVTQLSGWDNIMWAVHSWYRET